MPTPALSFFARWLLQVVVLINQVEKGRCRRTKCVHGGIWLFSRDFRDKRNTEQLKFLRYRETSEAFERIRGALGVTRKQ